MILAITDRSTMSAIIAPSRPTSFHLPVDTLILSPVVAPAFRQAHKDNYDQARLFSTNGNLDPLSLTGTGGQSPRRRQPGSSANTVSTTEPCLHLRLLGPLQPF